MLISPSEVTSIYKAIEKEETRAMEAALLTALSAAGGDTYSTTLLTRPANPMGSVGSWFLSEALQAGRPVSEDGLAIRIRPDDIPSMRRAPDIAWHSTDDASKVLYAWSDRSVVAAYIDPDTDDVLALPLALQFRSRLKDAAGASIKQSWRRCGPHGSPRSVILTVGDGDEYHVSVDQEADNPLKAMWLRQIAIEVDALFDYQAARPLHCADPAEFENTELPLGLNSTKEITRYGMAFLCRDTVHASDRHLGYRSFSPDEQTLLANALGLASAARLTEHDIVALKDYSIMLIAGSPYDGSPPHLELDAIDIWSTPGMHSAPERVAALNAIQEVLDPLLEIIRPTAVIHHDRDTKSCWTISQHLPSAFSNHERIQKMHELNDLIEKAVVGRR